MIDKLLQVVSSRCSQTSGLDLSIDSEKKRDLKNLSGQTYVKDDVADLEDFGAKPSASPRIMVLRQTL